MTKRGRFVSQSVAIIGGGAAGFFLAVCLKERAPHCHVTIFESGNKVLRKVKVSGGGRCNITNTFEHVTDLSTVYPRGHRLMKRLLKGFSPRDAYQWWESHGVRLTVQDDGCVFPLSQNSQEVIDCLTHHARRLGVQVVTGRRIKSLAELADYDTICVTTGSMTPDDIAMLGTSGAATVLSPSGTATASSPDVPSGTATASSPIAIVPPVPALFSFSLDAPSLTALAGLVVEADVRLPGTSFAASGALLITHWGVSGPAVLRLSSYAARHLAEHDYRATLSVNWLQMNDDEVRALLHDTAISQSRRLVANTHPEQLSTRLWEHITAKALADGTTKRWLDLSKKDMNRLVATLTADQYAITGRAPFRDEFVTCGGVALTGINPSTLASKVIPNLYFAGEALDIDGVTGGFNFQCAWTTAYTVAQSCLFPYLCTAE